MTTTVEFQSAGKRRNTFTVSRERLESQKKQFELAAVDDLMQFADPLPAENNDNEKNNKELQAKSAASLAAVLDDDDMLDFDDPALLDLLDGRSTSHISTTTTTTTTTISSSPSPQHDDFFSSLPSTGFSGFQTGRMKKVAVSEDALRKAQALLRAVDDDLEKEHPEIASTPAFHNNNNNKRPRIENEKSTTSRLESNKKSKIVTSVLPSPSSPTPSPSIPASIPENERIVSSSSRSSSQDSDGDASILLAIGSPDESSTPTSSQDKPKHSSPPPPPPLTGELGLFSSKSNGNSTTKSFYQPDTPHSVPRGPPRRVGLSRNSPAPRVLGASLPQSPTISHTRPTPNTVPQRRGPMLKRSFNPPSRAGVSKANPPENENSFPDESNLGAAAQRRLNFSSPRRSATQFSSINEPTSSPASSYYRTLSSTSRSSKSHIRKTPGTSLRDFVRGVLPQGKTSGELEALGVRPEVIYLNFDSASQFLWATKSEWQTTFPSILSTTPSSFLHPEEAVSVLETALLESGAKSSLLSSNWILNHSKLIVWKLASLERNYPEIFGTPYLTPFNLFSQLKHRYEKELERGERSILRKIMETDDIPGRYMVLCVTRVLPQDNTSSTPTSSFSRSSSSSSSSSSPPPTTTTTSMSSSTFVELTDGWYCIRASLDTFLSEKLKLGKIAPGQKLRVCCAKVQGIGQGISPLEVDEADITNIPTLVLSANGTRRAKWDSKLGLQEQRTPFRINIRSIVEKGGPIPALDVVVQRKYPTLFLETTGEGEEEEGVPVQKVIRNGFEEEEAVRLNELETSNAVEKVAEQIARDWERVQNRPKSFTQPPRRGLAPSLLKQVPKKSLAELDDGEDLYQAMLEKKSDWGEFLPLLKKDQREALTKYREQLEFQKSEFIRDKTMEALSKLKRNVTPLARVRLVDSPRFTSPSSTSSTSSSSSAKIGECILTIWRPAEEVLATLHEGMRIRLTGLTAGQRRDDVIQLSANGNSIRWRSLSTLSAASTSPTSSSSSTSVSATSSSYVPRSCLSSFAVLESLLVSPCRNFDGVGYVLHVTRRELPVTPPKTVYQIYLSDESEKIVAVELYTKRPLPNDLIGKTISFLDASFKGKGTKVDILESAFTDYSQFFLPGILIPKHAQHLRTPLQKLNKWAQLTTSRDALELLQDYINSVIEGRLAYIND